MNYIALGRQIRLYRQKKGITQEKLAALADISASFLGHIERGNRKPSIETLVNIANALCCGIDVFFAGQLYSLGGEDDRMRSFLSAVTVALREYQEE